MRDTQTGIARLPLAMAICNLPMARGNLVGRPEPLKFLCHYTHQFQVHLLFLLYPQLQ